MAEVIKVTQEVLDWFDGRIASEKEHAAGARRKECRAPNRICNGACPLNQAFENGCADVSVFKSVECGVSTFAQRGAWVDYLVALRTRCVVDDGTVLFRDVAPGTLVLTELGNHVRKLGKSFLAWMPYTVGRMREKRGDGYVAVVSDGWRLGWCMGDQRVTVLEEGGDSGKTG